MCGFTGWMDLRNEFRVDEQVLTLMTDQLVHRGPDSSGYIMEDHLALGFRRLSIIDLVHGDQPLFNEDGSIVLVCNGEIYNYQALRKGLIQKGHVFRTMSDVEVLIHLYEEEGEDLVKRLNGQFAFAIYDRNKKKLFLARDHFGIVPLHYAVVDGLFIFGSEIKALLKHPLAPREVDLTGLDQTFSFPGMVSPRTIFKGIKCLQSGHSISVESSNIKIKEYWDLDYPKSGEISYDMPDSYYIEGLKERLVQSVKYRLQSDVPVGAYLSGGLDSSLIAALIHRTAPAVKRDLFTIAFLDRGMDESKYQRILSKSVGAVNHEIVFDWPEISDRMRKMIYHCECPVKETYNTCSMALSEAARQNGVKVILTGEGADELFAGYVGYRFDPFRARGAKRHDLETILEQELRERLWGDKDLFYEKDHYAFREIKAELYSDAVNESFDEVDCLNFELVNKDRLKGRDFIHQRSYLDFKLRLSDHLISDHGDRMGLANSVEARYPFLDVELVEFSKRIPPALKLNGLTEKYILKKVAEGLIPQEIINREKFGFHAPGSPYLLQQNIEWINDMLSYERIKRQGYFNPDVVETLKGKYSQKGFKLNLPFEDDFLIVVLSFGVLLDVFDLPSLR
jgi:asparagine synthase (glutamine-hydrolysing)